MFDKDTKNINIIGFTIMVVSLFGIFISPIIFLSKAIIFILIGLFLIGYFIYEYKNKIGFINKYKNSNIEKGFLINKDSSKKIDELIKGGWEFDLHYGDHKNISKLKKACWEANFTKRKSNGLWDNHESGYSYCPNKAISKAFYNIKNGVRLKKGLY